MTQKTRRERLTGCYVTVPTMFKEDLSLDIVAIRQHVKFIIDGGITTGHGLLLAGGAAGDFSTLTFKERLEVAETIVDAADGQVPVVVGAQTTSTMEVCELARQAEAMGADFIQISPPFYFNHTEDDFYEFVVAAAEAADIGIILYNTFWTSANVSFTMVERLAELPNFAGLKWSTPDIGRMEFEQVILHFSDRLSIIDNQVKYISSHMLGARAIELHTCNYWPQWGRQLWQMLEDKQYVEVHQAMIDVVLPFMQVWQEMEQYTAGDGFLDKLCMELVGLGSSRCRPPTRDVRDGFRERTREMLLACGVPGVIAAP